MKAPWEIILYQGHGKVTLSNKIIKIYHRLVIICTDNDAKSVKSIKSLLFDLLYHAVIYFEKVKDPIKFEEDYASVCAFIQNAQLAAWDKNIGMLWTITPFMHDPEFSSDINIDPNIYKIAAVMQIGYPSKIPDAKSRIPIEDKIK